MKLQTYLDIDISLLDYTPMSSSIMKFACDICMKKVDDISRTSEEEFSPLASRLISAEHTSVLEHSCLVFLCKGISRSLLAQVTRQRHFSFTSASQHFQDYRDYPMSITPSTNLLDLYDKALCWAVRYYIELIEAGEPPEEARQVLPNACTVNLIITANPRALITFFRQRLCERNTQEMLIFARKMKRVCDKVMPHIFEHVGAPCFDGECNQGSLSCKKL